MNFHFDVSKPISISCPSPFGKGASGEKCELPQTALQFHQEDTENGERSVRASRGPVSSHSPLPRAADCLSLIEYPASVTLLKPAPSGNHLSLLCKELCVGRRQLQEQEDKKMELYGIATTEDAVHHRH